ncbi:MAG: oligosaccharide repeat unit polymerase [Clostridium sp.]|uniref:O-antigen polymerase n=1 Tax=Clostridium sp. TaxID=1506 RepID=UPI0025BE5243|nr:O-antigen polymerase [Clostridium sp.]MBS5927318.1 oligosaccharide repeat unit polymerase [Clostridium sp.]
MKLESIFSYIILVGYIIIFSGIYMYIKNIVKNNGFNMMAMFMLTFTMFYLIVPFVQTFFKSYRNETSIFNFLFNEMSEESIFFNVLICLICLICIISSYQLTGKRNYKMKECNEKTSVSEKRVLYKKLSFIVDIIFLISLLSIVLIIIEVGSIKSYLALGTLTRGIDKMPTTVIRSSYLQLITLSTLILVPPYVYLYLYRINRKKITKIKFVISFVFAILFLLYNQGRAPIILFVIPFIFSNKKISKKAIFKLLILFIFGLISLKYLDAIFKYLSYGNFVLDDGGNYIEKFLGEFSYPFTNFSIRSDLIEYSGYRYFYDYIVWPFTMIPSSLLKLIGLNKELIISISSVNTNIYGSLVGILPTGGIPVDFLTFNYYQFGYISLFLSCFVVGVFLKKFDNIFRYFSDNLPIRIILYRISFSIINILNNSDISAIVRNRLDIMVLIFLLMYIKLRIQKIDSNIIKNKAV